MVLAGDLFDVAKKVPAHGDEAGLPELGGVPGGPRLVFPRIVFKGVEGFFDPPAAKEASGDFAGFEMG